MKRLLTLWSTLASEEAKGCCTSAHMDIKTVHMRFKHEGLSFLAITLADFGKDFERSLDRGHVAPSAFKSWRTERHMCLPRFLRGFTELVFEPASGVLLEEPSIDAIRAIRQLTLMFSKMEVPCSDARNQAAFDDYVQCEKDVRELDLSDLSIELEDFKRISNLLFARVFNRLNSDIHLGRIVPKHGPGSTADRLIGNQKFKQTEWTARLQEVFPVWEHLIPNFRFSEDLEQIDILEPGSERPARVITVPKTLKTPRIIAMEPTAMQYIQQGIQKPLYKYVERNRLLSRTIGFIDQTPNQRLACQGSRDGSLATLDLSEASDRLSKELVYAMLEQHPELLKGVDACRSRWATVPGYEEPIPLAKFASMGSALCFPFEAMAFLALVFLGIERELNTRFTRYEQIIAHSRGVRVYGDDIIIPTDYVHSVIIALETFGLKVNDAKSFWTGRFRESCGREYFDGHDVSIVKVRDLFPESRADANRVSSLVSLRNQLYFAGLWESVNYLDGLIRKVLRYFPVVEPTSPVLGRHSFLQYQAESYDEDTQSPLVRGFVVSARLPTNGLDGSGALLKYLIKQGSLPAADGHLERSGRPVAVDIKLRKATPY